jgi:hypothetical protein
MINKGIIGMLLAISMTSCNGQIKTQDKGNKLSPDQPQTNITVNKQYDKNGNILKYDSTYSYYYSNIRKDTSLRDSIFKNFKNQFNNRYFFSKDPFFNDFFFQDSLLKYDFYKKDFFLGRFRNNTNRMDSLFWSMDSLKNDFFEKQFKAPGTLYAPKMK